MTTEYQRLGGHLPHEIEALVKEYAQPRYRKPLPPNLQADINAVSKTHRCFVEEHRYYKLCYYFCYQTTRVDNNITSFSYGWVGPRGKTIHPVRCGKSCGKCYIRGDE